MADRGLHRLIQIRRDPEQRLCCVRRQRLGVRRHGELQLGLVQPLDAFSEVNAILIEMRHRLLEVFRETRRILRPGGVFALAFSNRWFPPKVTRLWAELHPFERMGLVASYFAKSGGFAQIETYSLRGLPRPPSDPHAGRTPYADPVFAVSARRA